VGDIARRSSVERSSEEDGRNSGFDGVKKEEEASAARPCLGEKVRRKGGLVVGGAMRLAPARVGWIRVGGGGAARSAQKQGR
jgi:hypothetical protein